jgi:hypothetical protein
MDERKPELRTTNPALRNRPLAGILALAYAALFALVGYLESIRIEDYWPTWLLVVGGVIWFAIMLVLPFLVVQYFFGMDLSPLRRFSLRSMLLCWVPFLCVLTWYFTQMYWRAERDQWRISNRAAVRSTHGQAPLGLRLLGEAGESRIEIKNATKREVAEAKRLFPEATVVAVPEEGSVQGKGK